MDPTIIGRIAAHISGERIGVASANEVRLAEEHLGFAIPELLKSIYLNVANGGFGPGYGLIGVAGGHRSDLGSLVETFDDIAKGAQYLGLNCPPSYYRFAAGGGQHLLLC